MTLMKRADSVFEKISFAGEWWCPETPEIRVRGELSGCVAGDFHLTTEGCLEGKFMLDNDFTQKDKIILGESRSGHLFTLLQCFCVQRSGVPSAKGSEKYVAHWLLIGRHFHKYEDLIFKEISFGISNLEEWYDIRCFKSNVNFEERKASIEYASPAPVIVLDDEQVVTTIGYDYRPSGTGIAQKSATIEHAARITIEAKDCLALYEYSDEVKISFFEYIHRFVSFIQLAIGKEVFPYSIEGYIRSVSVTDYMPVEIYRIRRCATNTEPALFYEMLITWKDIADDPKKHFQAWVAKVRKIGMPVWLYLDSFREGPYQDQRFMGLAQGLEGFHRYRFPESAIVNDEHKKKIDIILQSCPQENRRWLKEKLRFSYEPSLRSRLKILFKEHADIISSFVGSEGKAKSLIGMIVDYRNQIAHCLDDGTQTLRGILLIYTIRFMRAILVLLLMEELEFSESQIENIVRNCREFQEVKRFFTKGTSL